MSFKMDQEGNYFRQDVEGKWHRVKQSAVPRHVVDQYEGKRAKPNNPRTAAARDRNDEKRKEEVKRVHDKWTQDETYRQLYGEAQDMSMLDRTQLYSGREFDKLGAGTADLFDIIRGMTGEDIETNLARRKARENEQAEKDRFFDPIKDASYGPEGFIGESGPYLMSGMGLSMGGKALQKAVNNTVRKTADSSAGVARTALSNADRNLRDMGNLFLHNSPKLRSGIEAYNRTPFSAKVKDLMQGTKQKFNREIGDPLNRQIQHVRNRKPIEGQDRNLLYDMVTGTSLAALEGGLHYDNSMLSGALAGATGTGTGRYLKDKLSTSRKYGTKPEIESGDDVLNWWFANGYRIAPGEKTGNPALQLRTDALRSHPGSAGHMKAYDSANEEVVLEQVRRAMGMTEEQLQQSTSKGMREHFSSLDARLRDLEANTEGTLLVRDFDHLVQQMGEMPEAVHKRFSGLLDGYTGHLDGKSYNKIKEQFERHAANANRDPVAQDFYREILDVVDKSMVSSVRNAKGEKKLAEWASLREQKALTDFALKNGFDANGNLNLTNFSNALINQDGAALLSQMPSKSVLSGFGGVKAGDGTDIFYRVAQLGDLKKRMSKSNLGDATIPGTFGKREVGINQSPDKFNLSGMDLATLKQYLRKYPSETGLLGLRREGPLTSENILRASAMGNHADVYQGAMDFWENPGEEAKDYYDTAKRKATNLMDYLGLPVY